MKGSPRFPADPSRYHFVDGDPSVLLVIEDTKLYLMPSDPIIGEHDLAALLPKVTKSPEVFIEKHPAALTLNIAQACNLACAYCYADEGRFGSQPQVMTADIAMGAIRRLFDESESMSVSIGFIGGEALLNSALMHTAVQYAVGLARHSGKQVTFGITTNATRLAAEDIELFRNHPFAVTVSLDGSASVHDGLRKSRDGSSSFKTAIDRLAPLLERPGQARIAARATISRLNLKVTECIAALAAVGFSEIGVSPLRTSPSPGLALGDEDWPQFLASMMEAAKYEWERVQTGAAFRFSNLATTLQQLHRGACNALPCGSVTHYASVSASGDYYTCHRTVEDPSFRIGNQKDGLVREQRESFIRTRLVDHQEPCQSCWARYLCGGGCHAEVLRSGRSGCDYIRGWLEYCMQLYPHVLQQRPDFFENHLPASLRGELQ